MAAKFEYPRRGSTIRRAGFAAATLNDQRRRTASTYCHTRYKPWSDTFVTVT